MFPPKPERPEIARPPAGSWLSIALVAGFGILMAAVISILTLGYFLWIFLINILSDPPKAERLTCLGVGDTGIT